MPLEPHISPITVHQLLGFEPWDPVFKSRIIHFGDLAIEAIQGALSEPFSVNPSAHDQLLQSLFDYLEGLFPSEQILHDSL